MQHISSSNGGVVKRSLALILMLALLATACQSDPDGSLGAELGSDPAMLLAAGANPADADDASSTTLARVLTSAELNETTAPDADESDDDESDDYAGAGSDADEPEDEADGDPDTDDSDDPDSEDPDPEDRDIEDPADEADDDTASSTTTERGAPDPATPTSTTQASTTRPTTASSTTTRPGSTTAAPTTAAPNPAPGGFRTLPVGAALPSGAECAARVQPAAETKSMNGSYNGQRGIGANGLYPRVDGNFTGTTDEVIQWAACKWGLDEDLARAQAVIESWWQMPAAGDLTSEQGNCHVDLQTGSGQCPESIGLFQVRWQYHQEAFANSNAIRSSAYNADYALAVWRECFEGKFGWLGSGYGAGDADGCLGVWFSGQWYPPEVSSYIAEVYKILNERTWEQAYFRE